jgi:ppGpp synthetase/RelA/SpoT-type nucleotidyltranferase
MASEFTRSSVKRLGRRLRKAERPSPDDVAMYDAYRKSFASDSKEVMTALYSLFPDSPPSGRSKTLDSVVGKLKRGTTDLGRMQDIAGCRINVPSLDDQDRAVAMIQERFEALRTDDLRERPHSGYRAVHVIVAAPGGRWVEIQVRTALQNLYAQLSERMADAFGIEMKYGGGDPFAREILRSSSSRAYELDTLKREIDARETSGGPAPEHAHEDRRTLEEATDRYRTIVQAIIQALKPSQEERE